MVIEHSTESDHSGEPTATLREHYDFITTAP